MTPSLSVDYWFFWAQSDSDSSWRNPWWPALLTCKTSCSMEALASPSCAVWALHWRTVRRRMATTPSLTCSDTTSTSHSSSLALSWHLTSITPRWGLKQDKGWLHTHRFTHKAVSNSSGEQHPADPQGEGDVEHHYQGLVACGRYSGGGHLLPLPLHPDNPQRPEAGGQAVWLVSGWVRHVTSSTSFTVPQCACGELALLSPCSWSGLLQPCVWLGESSCDVWHHQHRGHSGPPGPSPAAQVSHHALRLLRDVSTAGSSHGHKSLHRVLVAFEMLRKSFLWVLYLFQALWSGHQRLVVQVSSPAENHDFGFQHMQDYCDFSSS